MSKFGNTMFDSLKGSNIMNKSKLLNSARGEPPSNSHIKAGSMDLRFTTAQPLAQSQQQLHMRMNST